jgi:hypothetical protein
MSPRLCSIFLMLILLAAACGGGSGKPAGTSNGRDPCISPGQLGGATPEDLLTCDNFTQPLYWLGEELGLPGLPDVQLNGSYTEYDEQPISALTHVVLDYGPRQTGEISLTEWYRLTWGDYVAKFTGYDPSTVPPNGPVNWWQHPCVEEETYGAGNGAEVHLFRAHLDSLIYILPMSPEEVASCRLRPVGVVGAHIYFDKTVIELDFSTEAGNPYNNEDVVRYVAAALRPYKSQ